MRASWRDADPRSREYIHGALAHLDAGGTLDDPPAAPSSNPGPVYAGKYGDDGGLPEVPSVPTIVADGKTYPAPKC